MCSFERVPSGAQNVNPGIYNYLKSSNSGSQIVSTEFFGLPNIYNETKILNPLSSSNDCKLSVFDPKCRSGTEVLRSYRNLRPALTFKQFSDAYKPLDM
ncbi:unnamed protein product [Allacma fusca]|uniref:Uncharacterized protein n=1 Tax=Allacma fusca TaxID=39272 RepID=A0A8J2JIT4_9HEXA|nr:unnamed protein product [Allacma fusca]